jgi:hypothetical protein
VPRIVNKSQRKKIEVKKLVKNEDKEKTIKRIEREKKKREKKERQKQWGKRRIAND